MTLARVVLLSTFLLGIAALGCSTETPTSPGPQPPAPVAEKPSPDVPVLAEIPAGTVLSADVDRSKFEFTGSKITGSHVGGFKIYEATAEWGGETLSSGEVVIDVTSLYTDAERLTGHMLSADFFDAESHPKATFKTTSITPSGATVNVVGDLDLRGVSQPIEFPAEVSMTADGVKMTARFEIDRQRWGVAYPGLPDDLIKDEVPIEFELVFPAS